MYQTLPKLGPGQHSWTGLPQPGEWALRWAEIKVHRLRCCLPPLARIPDKSNVCGHLHVEQYRWAPRKYPTLLKTFLKSHHKDVKFPSQKFLLWELFKNFHTETCDLLQLAREQGTHEAVGDPGSLHGAHKGVTNFLQ